MSISIEQQTLMEILADVRTVSGIPIPSTLLPQVQNVVRIENPPLFSSKQVTQTFCNVRYEETHVLKNWLEKNFSWFVNANYAEAQEYLEALSIVGKRRMDTQFSVYQRKLRNVCQKDLAQRTDAFALNQLNYQGFRYYDDGDKHFGRRTFDVPIETKGGIDYLWRYRLMGDFLDTIPLHALRALEALDKAGIEPDDFWVADKLAVEHPVRQTKLDPVLCCAFGQWFIGIADWI